MKPLFAFSALALIARTLLAQPGEQSPLDAATNKTDKPLAVVPEPAQTDALVDRSLRSLTGSFVHTPASPTDEHPALVLNSAPVSIAGLPNTTYFEISRDGIPWAPFRQGLFHVYRRQGELRLRIFDIASANPGLKDTLIGLYLSPEAFPAITTAQLSVNLDIPLAEKDGALTGSTTQPVPTTRDGASELTASVRIADQSLAFTDAGFDTSGAQVWGTAQNQPLIFIRQTSPPAKIARLEGNLIVITLVPPLANQPKLAEGGELAVHYTGWTTDGTRFDSSRPTERQPDRPPYKFRPFPGTLIKGWLDGLKDIAKGERRRVIIPPALAYAEKGAPRAGIPPNATLIFDIECLYVDNTPLPTPPKPTPPSPH